MIKFSRSLKLNEIHMVDSPFNEDPKNISSFREALILGKGRPENVEKMGNNRYIYCYANWGVINFEREYQPLPPGIKILRCLNFPTCQTNFRKKMKKLNFRAKIWPFFRVLSSQNLTMYSKNFKWPNVLGYRLGIAKISFKNLHSFWSYLENDSLSRFRVKVWCTKIERILRIVVQTGANVAVW